MADIPKPIGGLREHYWLAQRMAKAVGATVVQAHAEGRLSQDDWAAMIQRCRGCAWAEGCRCWLAQNESAEEVPERCENRAGLQALRDG